MKIYRDGKPLPRAALLEDAEVSWAYREECNMWLCLLLWAGWQA